MNPEDQPDYVPLLGRPEDADAQSQNPKPPVVAVPEHSHAGESANGAAEKGVQLVEDQCRTLKAALEDRLAWKIPEGHAIMHWLM